MTQLVVFVAIGTGATLLAAALLLLRAKAHGWRPLVALIRRWHEASTHDACLVLVLFCAVAASCFAGIAANEVNKFGTAAALNPAANTSSAETTDFDESSGAAEAWDALRAYAEKIDTPSQSKASASSSSSSSALPEVDTMIAKLAARLVKQPNDVKGWKMLGWSYLNTNQPVEAVQAYETALKLQPGDVETKQGLEQAKSAQIPTNQNSSSEPAAAPTAGDIRAPDKLRPH